MLFGLFVIIGVIALSIMLITAGGPKGLDEYERLQAEYDHARRQVIYTPLDNDFKWLARARQVESKAYEALQTFKKEHPDFEKQKARRETWFNVSGGFLIGAGCIIIIMLAALAIIYLDAPSQCAEQQAEYEALMFEMHHSLYIDDGDVVGHKELYDQIRNYNKHVARKKAKVHDFWLGIFVPDYYADLPLIELK